MDACNVVLLAQEQVGDSAAAIDWKLVVAWVLGFIGPAIVGWLKGREAAHWKIIGQAGEWLIGHVEKTYTKAEKAEIQAAATADGKEPVLHQAVKKVTEGKAT